MVPRREASILAWTKDHWEGFFVMPRRDREAVVVTPKCEPQLPSLFFLFHFSRSYCDHPNTKLGKFGFYGKFVKSRMHL